MRRREAERLAELIDDATLRPSRSVEDRELARLATIGHKLAALERVEPDNRFVVDLRAQLMSAAAGEGIGSTAGRRGGKWVLSKMQLCIAAVVAVVAVAATGVSFAGDTDTSRRPPATEGPLVPAGGSPASNGVGDQPGRHVGAEPTATPGAGQSATPEAPPEATPGASAGSSTSAETTSAPPPPPPPPPPSDRGLLDKLRHLFP